MKPIIRWPLLAALILLIAAPDLMAQAPVDRSRERAVERAEEQRRQAERQADRDRQQADRNRQQADRNRQQADRNRQQADRNRQQSQPARQQNQRGGQAGGPQFCRNGSGHPQFGMQWCYDKGFATPYGRFGNVIWQRGSLGDVRVDDRNRNARQGTLAERVVRDVLGRTATDRARNHGRSLGLDGALTGRWIDATTLELQMDGRPVARLTDADRNGRFGTTLLARYR